MPGKAVFTFMSLLTCLGLAAPVLADEPDREGYLHIMYSWQLMPTCRTPEVFSAQAPFVIRGREITGTYTRPELSPDKLELVDLTIDPMGPIQRIDFTYDCGICTVEGTHVFHEVKGKVVKYGGKDMLRFSVSHSRPVCMTACLPPSNDCSDREVVVDEFMTPDEDGFIVDRGQYTILKYGVHLE